jgi:hypothetical protein
MSNLKKRTPAAATEFEREQLRFFLKDEDISGLLKDVNPSLAWLPVLGELKLITRDTHLAPWIEQYFSTSDAVREVVANLHFFGIETVNFMELFLQRTEGLSPVLMKCWQLIIRHIRSIGRNTARSDWFDIRVRLKRGECSPDLLARLMDALRPRLRIGKRLSLYGIDAPETPQSPLDLMSIEYEVEDNITGEEVLSVWPEGSAPEADERLLKLLTNTLYGALEDAIDAGVEGEGRYGISDSNIPSIASHEQNAYHSGFLPIVRTIADLWTRLARKDSRLALQVLQMWRETSFRLFRRLALFAAADSIIPAEIAADILLSLPQDELFLAGASVEVHRLIQRRWSEFSSEKQQAVETRATDGPSEEAFRDDADKEVIIDHCRLNLLSAIERTNVELNDYAKEVLADIRQRHPQWTPHPEERAGFHIWRESRGGIVHDSTRLDGVPDDQLIAKATEEISDTNFTSGSSWDTLCRDDPERAFRGLKASANQGVWPAWAWRGILWTKREPGTIDLVRDIAEYLLKWPVEQFGEILDSAAWWLNEHAAMIEGNRLWELWDFINEHAPRDDRGEQPRDALTDALNSPAGRLAEILVSRIGVGETEAEFFEKVGNRLNKLVGSEGTFGKQARVRLAAELSLLYERAPEWTTGALIPLFSWSAPDAHAVWFARSYSNYIGSPALMDLTKQPFLEIFGKADISDQEIRAFSDWLTVIVLYNQHHPGGYPISGAEARAALRRAGTRSLTTVGHRLAIEFGAVKPEEKLKIWRTIIGPAFQAMWPLDTELQTSDATFKLTQILLASGDAFPEAADTIIPFIRPDDPRQHTTVFVISEADSSFYSLSPQKLLDLLAAAVGDAQPGATFGLKKTLERLEAQNPTVRQSAKFQRLLRLSEQ